MTEGTIQGRGKPSISENIYKEGSPTTQKSTNGYVTHVQNNTTQKSQQNAIQHACRHFRQTKQKECEIKWTPTTEKEKSTQSGKTHTTGIPSKNTNKRKPSDKQDHEDKNSKTSRKKKHSGSK